MSSSTLEVAGASGAVLRVNFSQQGDRFSHAVTLVQDGQETLLLRSVEGDADQVFPPSPPYVELHQQEATLFLTGATQAGHWSMSIQAEGESLLFDTACRLKQVPDWLGNTYSIKNPSGCSIFPCEESCTLEVSENQLDIVCKVSQDLVTPATVRWRYRIALSNT